MENTNFTHCVLLHVSNFSFYINVNVNIFDLYACLVNYWCWYTSGTQITCRRLWMGFQGCVWPANKFIRADAHGRELAKEKVGFAMGYLPNVGTNVGDVSKIIGSINKFLVFQSCICCRAFCEL